MKQARTKWKQETKLRLIILGLFYSGVACFLFPFVYEQTYYTWTSMQQRHVELQTLNSAEDVSLEKTAPFQLEDLRLQLNAKAQVIARLIGPDLDLNETIELGNQATSLARGGGWLFPERKLEKDNVVLLGHHVSNPRMLFSPLVKAKVGQSLYVQTKQKFYRYKIKTVKVVAETQIDVLKNTKKPQLTLLTCETDQPTSKRLIVKAELLQQKNLKEVRQQAQSIQKKTAHTKQIKLMMPNCIILMFVLLFMIVVTYLVFRFVQINES